MNIDISRYTPRKILRGIKNPNRMIGEIRHISQEVNRLYYEHRGCPSEAIEVMDEDWDNLLILDAARYDTFSQEHDLTGRLERRISKGSSSSQFMRENFQNRKILNTVYVSANPNIAKVSEAFYDTVNLYETGWDEELKTVGPETVGEAAVKAQQEYSNKQLIIHFMQPHTPYIGDLGRTMFNTGTGPDTNNDRCFWPQLQYGKLDASVEKVWKAYRENLNIVLSEVEELLDDLVGKSVITADHGQLIGDRLRPVPTRGFAHPNTMYVDELIKIPWFIVEADERPDIRSEPPVEKNSPEQELVEDRLKDLGYKI